MHTLSYHLTSYLVNHGEPNAHTIQEFQGDSWFINKPGWNASDLTSDHCSWYGIECCTPTTCTNDPYCNCTIGYVTSVKLPSNNLIGDGFGFIGNLDRWADPDAIFITSALGCSILECDLSNNRLNGTLPPDIIALPHLKSLNLAGNEFVGTVPERFGSLTGLQYLDLSNNALNGTVPSNLCGYDSPLSDLLFGNNRQLKGNLDISQCVSLFIIDASNTNITGDVTAATGYNKLHIARLSNTGVTNITQLVAGGHITDLDLDYSAINGPIPSVTTSLASLNSLSIVSDGISNNFVTGTLPPKLFAIGALRTLNLNNNFLTGTIPSISTASSLKSLELSNNGLSGTIPPDMVAVLAGPASLVDLRLNYLSCCAIGPLVKAQTTGVGRRSLLSFSSLGKTSSVNVSYVAYNLSLPRLPPGLKFSSTLQPVTAPYSARPRAGAMSTLSNSSFRGLKCPSLLLSNAADIPSNILSWFIDPEYTLFEGCQCDPGFLLLRSSYLGLLIVECVIPPPPSDPWWVQYWWIFLIIGAFAFAILLFVIWKAASGSRSKLMQEFFDAQRRAKGPPTTGQISIVVTDIEGFSNMMKGSPEACMQAVILHNNLLQKARHACFGYLIESEGDSFSILFESPSDAVKFCIMAQLLLASAKWPKGLFTKPDLSFDKQSSETSASVRGVRSQNSFITARTPSPSFTNLLTSPLPSYQDATDDIVKSPKSPQQVQGLRVRMGAATGTIEAPTTPAFSSVLERAKLIGDAACGGQILFCDTTFCQVKDMTEDLGCMTEEGMDLELLKSDKAGWAFWWRGRKERLDHEALILHMGDYLSCVEPSIIPTILKPSDLKDSKRLLSLYQLLSPKLGLSRGRSFGNMLRLKPEWIQVDGGYFDAPGALGFPLGSSDKGSKDDVFDPFVATVFIQVDSGKAYAAKHRSDAAEIHSTLQTLIKSTLRLCPGGYLAKAQDGELKYLLTFSTTEAAVFWCFQLQMASIFAPWPETALRYWPEERGVGENEGVLLFRGPRIKIGIAAGHLRRIAADWTGRADVHGDSVNQAARFMDAAAWGGQIALEESLAVNVMESMRVTSMSYFHQLTAGDLNFSNSSYSNDEIALAQPPLALSPIQLQEITPEVAQEAKLEVSTTIDPQGSQRPSKATPSALSGSFSLRKKSAKPSNDTWELPDHQHLQADPLTLVCEKLGRFTFKGSDEILDMVNLSPTSLLARPYPSDAPQGKGERVSLPSPPTKEVLRVELPSMRFIDEMREEHHSPLAQATQTRPVAARRQGRERLAFGQPSRFGSGLMRVTEEGEGSESSGDNSVRPSTRPSLISGWRDRYSRNSRPSKV